MVYVVHHSVDFDGFFSALITGIGILKEEPEETIKFVPYNYSKDGIIVGKKKDEVRLEDIVEPNDQVYFVDVSCTDKNVMSKIINKIGDDHRVILIDHHETSIEWVKKECPTIEYSWSANSSDPSNPKLSAAALCWNRFFPDYNIPEIIKLISDYDVWNKENKERWDEKILPFQYGMRNKGINMFDPASYLEEYEKVIFKDSETEEFISDAIDAGKAVIEYQKSRSKMVLRSTGFGALLDIGEKRSYMTYFAADYCANSTLFEWGLSEEEQEKYDLFVLCRPVIGSNKSYISIISNRDDIDSSRICERFGGGGHKQIAGCVVYINRSSDEESSLENVTFSVAEK